MTISEASDSIMSHINRKLRNGAVAGSMLTGQVDYFKYSPLNSACDIIKT